MMIFVVITRDGRVKACRCMDDALDFIRDMEDFDKAEGMYSDGWYRVETQKEEDHGKD